MQSQPGLHGWPFNQIGKLVFDFSISLCGRVVEKSQLLMESNLQSMEGSLSSTST